MISVFTHAATRNNGAATSATANRMIEITSRERLGVLASSIGDEDMMIPSSSVARACEWWPRSGFVREDGQYNVLVAHSGISDPVMRLKTCVCAAFAQHMDAAPDGHSPICTKRDARFGCERLASSHDQRRCRGPKHRPIEPARALLQQGHSSCERRAEMAEPRQSFIHMG